MGTLHRFQALRSHAEKLYRINQGKALAVLNEELKPGRFDDVQSGVCAALCVVWLQAMLKMKKLPRLRDQFKYAAYRPYHEPSGLFVGTPDARDIARSLTKPKLLTNQDVVALQRRYKQVVLDEPFGPSKPYERQFWTDVVQSCGLRMAGISFASVPGQINQLHRQKKPLPGGLQHRQYTPVPLGDQMTFAMAVNGFDAASGPEGIGLHLGVSITLMPEDRELYGHAFGLLRLGAGATSPLYFFDANCGVYCIRRSGQRYDRSAFFGALVDAYGVTFRRMRKASAAAAQQREMDAAKAAGASRDGIEALVATHRAAMEKIDNAVLEINIRSYFALTARTR